jgi:hypothetical protein
MSSLD